MSDAVEKHWAVDRRIPVPLIAALAAQTFAVVVAMSVAWTSLSNRVDNIETFVRDSKAATAASVSIERERGDRLIRVETLMEGIQRSVTNIERKLDSTRQSSNSSTNVN